VRLADCFPGGLAEPPAAQELGVLLLVLPAEPDFLELTPQEIIEGNPRRPPVSAPRQPRRSSSACETRAPRHPIQEYATTRSPLA
jgi:hypothetical protein